MHNDKEEIDSLREIVLENKRLVEENNQLLNKILRRAVWSFWLKVVWFLIIIGAPFLLYYSVIEPYFESMGSSFEVFISGMQEVPGWKQFYEAAKGRATGGE